MCFSEEECVCEEQGWLDRIDSVSRARMVCIGMLLEDGGGGDLAAK